MSAGDGGVGDGMGGNVLAEAQFCGEWEVDKTGVCNEEVFSNGVGRYLGCGLGCAGWVAASPRRPNPAE